MREILLKFQNCKPCREDNPLHTIVFIQMVEMALTDLTFLHMEQELNFALLTSELERKFTERMKEEWTTLVAEDTDENAGNIMKMVAYLSKKKTVLKKLTGALGASSTMAAHGARMDNGEGRRDERVFNGTCNYCEERGHPAFKCKVMEKDNLKTREEKFFANNMCGRCTIIGHRMEDCRRRGNRTCDKTKADGSRCTSRHASFLHGTMRLEFVGTTEIIMAGTKGGNGTLLLYQRIMVDKNYKAFVFFDNGSSASLIP